MYQTAPHRPGDEACLVIVRLLSITRPPPPYVKAPIPQSFNTHCISRQSFHRLNEVMGWPSQTGQREAQMKTWEKVAVMPKLRREERAQEKPALLMPWAQTPNS